jgi:Ner family transcriptional regulator
MFIAMETSYIAKNSRSSANQSGDMHRADIIAAIWKAGTTIRRLSAVSGLSPDSLKRCLTHQWPRAEAIVAACLGVHPATIWPSRYTQDGKPLRQPRRPRRRKPASNDSAAPGAHHVNVPEGA